MSTARKPPNSALRVAPFSVKVPVGGRAGHEASFVLPGDRGDKVRHVVPKGARPGQMVTIYVARGWLTRVSGDEPSIHKRPTSQTKPPWRESSSTTTTPSLNLSRRDSRQCTDKLSDDIRPRSLSFGSCSACGEGRSWWKSSVLFGCMRPQAAGLTGVAAHGFDSITELKGTAKQRGEAGAHSQGRLNFGTWLAPAGGKDQDRTAHRAFAPLNGGTPVFGFGLFDGHGMHAGVADLARQELLSSMKSTLQPHAAIRTAMSTQLSSSSEEMKEERAGDSLDRPPSSGALDCLLGEPSSMESLQFSRYSNESGLRLNTRVKSHADDRSGPTELITGSPADAPESNGGNFAEVCGPLLKDAFKSVANRVDVEYRGERVGSTGTVLLVQRRKVFDGDAGESRGEGEWVVACAWVGDSRAIIVGPNGRVLQALSTDHRLSNHAERERCLDVAATENAGPAGRRNERRTVVSHRVSATTGKVGPLAVLNEATGVSTTVTRAFGDSLAASAVISKPELTHTVVPSGSKIIACSDGVWDVFTEAKVATMIQGSRDPLKAARRVVGAAKQARLYNGIVADDISAIVINLD